LYVALTRAMCKLYVPWAGKASYSPGPLPVHLTPLLERADVERHVVGLRSNEDAPKSAAAIREARRAGSESPTRSAATSAAALAAATLAAYLREALPADLARRRVIMQSFSSLQRRLGRTAEGAHFGEGQPRRDDDVPDALAREDPLRGAHFGQLVHDVLEGIDFAEVGQATGPAELTREGTAARALLDRLLTRYLPTWPTRLPADQLGPAAITLIGQLVWNALHTPLPGLQMPLHVLAPRDRLHEVEFHFPMLAPAACVEEVQASEGFLTGFIDLVFRCQGRYYFLDWKTNLLEGYDGEHIRVAMAASGYERQYRLYLQALARWLKSVHGREFPFLERFGGVFYLFLRGLGPQAGDSGVFFHRPTPADLELKNVLT
jgi:ATP-dependent exoDNAse (exonuclease V) beta subunit